MKKTAISAKQQQQQKVVKTATNDASFESEIKEAIRRLPATVKKEAVKFKTPRTVVEQDKIVRINIDKTKEVIGKIKKITPKVKLQKVMHLS